MRALLDTSVLLDLFLNREPWAVDAATIWNSAHERRIDAQFSAFALPTVFYVVRRHAGLTAAHESVRLSMETLEIVPVGRSTLEMARTLSGADFEDNLQIASAFEANADTIVTRDASGFAASPISVMAPADFVRMLLI